MAMKYRVLHKYGETVEAVASLKAALGMFMPDLREFVITIPEAGQLLSAEFPTLELRY